MQILGAIFLLVLLFSPVYAVEFRGGAVGVIEGDTLHVLTTRKLSGSTSTAFTALRRASLTASKPDQNCFLVRNSRFRLTARISTGGPLPMCPSAMVPTPNTSWLRTAGAGGMGSLHRSILILSTREGRTGALVVSSRHHAFLYSRYRSHRLVARQTVGQAGAPRRLRGS
jgi:hypothetical protein